MDDYQNDTCVGKYLKKFIKEEFQKIKEKKEPEYNRTKSSEDNFMDYPGLKDKVIFGMGGYGGKLS